MALDQPVSLAELLRGNPNTQQSAYVGIQLGGYGYTLSAPLANHWNNTVLLLNSISTSTQASQTATVGGTLKTGDRLVVTADRGDGTTFSAGYVVNTVVDTTTTIAATNLAAALNADPNFGACFVATSAAAVVTVKPKRKGTRYNGRPFVCSVTGTATTTTLVAGAATFAGGTGIDDVLQIV